MELEANQRILTVDDFDDERLSGYRNLKERTLRGESLFVAEGALVVERLLRSPFDVESVLITRKDGLEDCLALVPDSVPIYLVEERIALSSLVGFEFSRGILAIGRRRELPTVAEGFERYFSGISRRERELSAPVQGVRRRAWVVLPDASKPDNLGLVFRCAAALDAEAVILGEKCCDPFSRRALRVSMGGVLQTPIYRAENLLEELRDARERWNVAFYATVLDDAAVSLYDFGASPFAGCSRVAFVFGNEYSGLTPEMIDFCDQSVKIPMRGDVDSLNLGVSVGVFLYEFNRGNYVKNESESVSADS